MDLTKKFFRQYAITLSEKELDHQRRKMIYRGRIKIFLLFLFCVSPMIISYLAYYVVQPRWAMSTYGFLIQPQRLIPDNLYVRPLLTNAMVPRVVNMQPVALTTLFKKKWLLISVHRAAQCLDDCVKKLFVMRQLRIAQGSKRAHIIPLWIITDDAPVDENLVKAYGSDYAAGNFVYANSQILNQWLPTKSEHTVESYLYLVDPMGHLMMRFPGNPDHKGMYRDLSKLLKWNVIGKEK